MSLSKLKPENDQELEAMLTETFGPPPRADVDAWRNRYPSALAWLNPERISVVSQRRKQMQRILLLAATTAAALCVWIGLSHFNPNGTGASAFAQTVEQIQKAKTMTWKTHFFEHITSRDKKTTWAVTEVMENAYKEPGLYRETRLDDKGQINSVEITDSIRGRKLRYFPKEKRATVEEIAACSNPSGPFGYHQKKLEEQNLQWIGKRTTETGECNLFRNAFRDHVNERNWSVDYWIDAQSKQLVAVYQPGADIYDYEHDPARNVAPGEGRSGMFMRGGGEVDIRYDVALDDSLFRTEPPEGYAVEFKKRDRVTEKEMIDYFGLLADFNDRNFPDQVFPLPHSFYVKRDRTTQKKYSPKPGDELTAVERKFLDADMHYGLRFPGGNPIVVFFSWDPDNIVKDSFRYLGKGVKLGDKTAIVCWYKLKDAKDPNAYRVVYGDLSVKDVAAKDLPLPVEP
jgi:hypothetical protein